MTQEPETFCTKDGKVNIYYGIFNFPYSRLGDLKDIHSFNQLIIRISYKKEGIPYLNNESYLEHHQDYCRLFLKKLTNQFLKLSFKIIN
jgi:hypothetical protein